MNRTKIAIRNIIKANCDEEEYKKLTYFEWVKHLKTEMPGTWHLYIWLEDGIACATNALCINEWLDLHGQGQKAPMADKVVNYKIEQNAPHNIDNRTEQWTKKESQLTKRSYDRGNRDTIDPKSLTSTIYNMYYNEKLNLKEIANIMDFTVPNIHYHIKKHKKLLNKQKDLTNDEL
tara:strand:- start:1361 stop:1888 length:528 start_codon:yes stop_codon:yes gene_type:complete